MAVIDKLLLPSVEKISARSLRPHQVLVLAGWLFGTASLQFCLG